MNGANLVHYGYAICIWVCNFVDLLNFGSSQTSSLVSLPKRSFLENLAKTPKAIPQLLRLSFTLFSKIHANLLLIYAKSIARFALHLKSPIIINLYIIFWLDIFHFWNRLIIEKSRWYGYNLVWIID